MVHRARKGKSPGTSWLLISGALLASLVLITSAIAVAPGLLNGHAPFRVSVDNTLTGPNDDGDLLEQSLGQTARDAQPELPDPDAEHRPVRVRSDEALRSLAETHGTPAHGTAKEPLVILGSRIDEMKPTSLLIQNTDLHLVVDGLELAGHPERVGIRLDQANNVTFRDLAASGHHTAVLATNATNLVVQGSQFDGNRRAIVLYGTHDVDIRENRFTENGFAVFARDYELPEIELHGPVTKRITFADNHVTRVLPPGGLPEEASFLGTGVTLVGDGLSVTGNKFEGQYPAALRVQGTDIQVTVNEFRSENERGVLIMESKDVMLRDNRFHRNLNAGIVAHGSSSVQLVGNEFDRNPQGGIRIVGGKDFEIKENRFDWSHDAIRLHSTRDSVISANSIHGGTQGVNLAKTESILITDNAFAGVWEDAVRVLWSSHTEIVDNTVDQGKRHGFLMWDANDVDISGNAIHATQFGIIVMGESSQVTVDSNRIDGKARIGLWVLQSDHTTLTDNEVHEQDFGVLVSSNPTNARVQGGLFSANYAGVLIEDNDEPVTIEHATMAGNIVGVLVEDSRGPQLRDLVLKENNIGVLLARSQSARLTDSHVVDNQLGAYLAKSTNSLLYNNVFQNPDQDRNVLLINSPGNQWNIHRTPGPNIIGGPWIAGNFWHDYIGVDVEGDGIGSVPHQPIPYHPLLELPAYELGLPMGPFDLHPLVK